jgi:nucleoside-diphosphate-sugar epimerase
LKRVLVTGAGGFIGRHVIPQLITAEYEVHAVYRHPSGPPLPGVVSWQADLLNPDSSSKLIDAVRPSHLLHLAWYVEHGKYWNAPENVEWLKASLDLLTCFLGRGGERCVTAGTCAEYDWTGDGPFEEETTLLRPHTLYGTTKHALHLMQSALCRRTGSGYSWGRIFHMHGPHESPERFVPFVIRTLLRGKPVPCSHGMQERDFLHVEDVARAFVCLLDAESSGPVNIGSGETVKLGEIARMIAAELGGEELLQFGATPAAANDPPRLIPDISRLRQLGFRPKWNLRDGLHKTIDWWRLC